VSIWRRTDPLRWRERALCKGMTELFVLDRGNDAFSPAGLIGSIIGAIIALLIYRWATGPRRRMI
jgi:hypothetical protein